MAGAKLDHAGRWLTDGDGRVVMLHGVNMVNKLPPYHPAAIGFGAEHAEHIAAEGFNTVRLGIIWKALEPEPGSYDDGYLDEITATADALAERGMHVLVDFHQDMFNERFSGEGFPDWAVQDHGLPAFPDLGFPRNYFVMIALWRAYDHFWRNDPAPDGTGLQDRYALAWGHVAERLCERPAVFYDIFNEPFAGSLAARCMWPAGYPRFDRGPLSRLSRKVFAAIRAVDGSKLVFYEPNVCFNNGPMTHHADMADPRAGFSFHNYCLAATPGMPRLPGRLQGPLCRREERRVFENAEQHSRSTGSALLLSEFGASDDLVALARMVDHCDRHMVSWQYWSYWNRDVSHERPEEGVVHDLFRPPQGSNVKHEKLDVLVRPYPRAVAGTPTRFGFDPATREFTLAWESRPSELPTEVHLPRRQYGRGYEVRASGASVQSQAGDELLVLAPEPRARSARVRVIPD